MLSLSFLGDDPSAPIPQGAPSQDDVIATAAYIANSRLAGDADPAIMGSLLALTMTPGYPCGAGGCSAALVAAASAFLGTFDPTTTAWVAAPDPTALAQVKAVVSADQLGGYTLAVTVRKLRLRGDTARSSGNTSDPFASEPMIAEAIRQVVNENAAGEGDEGAAPGVSGVVAGSLIVITLSVVMAGVIFVTRRRPPAPVPSPSTTAHAGVGRARRL